MTTSDGGEEALKRAAAILNYKNRSSEALRLKLLEKDVAPEDALAQMLPALRAVSVPAHALTSREKQKRQRP